jgi:hypothetical protein
MASDATIFIPGIKGTKLTETNRPTWDVIWSGIQHNFETIEDLELTAAYRGEHFEENPHSIIRPSEIESLAYDEFLRDLATEAPVYIFNYDWRLSASNNGERLKRFMDYLVDKSRARSDPANDRRASIRSPIERFDFISHSLGNFILRNYIARYGFRRINKIVFAVPPFEGSIDVVAGALIGEGFFPNVKAKIRKYIRTWPGALELLPSYDGASRFVPGNRVHSFFNFNHWQDNVVNAEGPIPEKMKKALRLARSVVNGHLCDLRALPPDQRKRILIIVRDGFETWQSVRVQKEEPGKPRNFVDFDYGLRTSDGDGRVPHVSSCCYCDAVKTLILKNDFWHREYNHGFFLKDERAQTLVNRFLYKGGRFKSTIPGDSIKRVAGLERKEDSSTGMPFWRARVR